MSIQFLQLLNESNDEEIVALARKEGFSLSKAEVRALRPYLEQFALSWLFLGIPKNVLSEVEHILGRKRSRQLLAMFTK